MKNKYPFLFNIITVLLFLTGCQSNKVTVVPEDSSPVIPFFLTEVELFPGPFEHATKLNVLSLLNYDPDRLLARFRIQAGLEPKAEAYGGWEAMSLAGHSLGHHLSACALMFQTTGDPRFKERASYIVDELEITQRANGGQYLGAFDDGKRIFEEEVANGEIKSQGFYLNGIWAPFYTHHKVMAGLRDAYRLLGIENALEIEKNMADWIGSIVLGLSREQAQEMMVCEIGGIQEVLADLYIDTSDEKYLQIARIFHHETIVDPLGEGRDILPQNHGNTQIPKLIASTRLYEISGEERDIRPAEFFWDRVVNHHSYVTGGHGNHEYFGAPDQLRNRLSDGTTETCNVYNMLKLSRNLFLIGPNAKISDFYERALFNHILSSQHPESGRVIYNLSLEMGGYKHYQNPYGFTCCVGSGMETHSKYGANIYYHNEEELYVSQFISSALNWKEKGLKLEQHTQFPEEQGSQFVFHLDEPTKLAFNIRYPAWAENGINIAVNGKAYAVDAGPGNFLTIDRIWNDGDQVIVEIPFSLRLETMPDDEDRIAVFYGPLLLAGDLGPEDDENANESNYVPVFMSEDRNPEQWLKHVQGEVNTFQSVEVGDPRELVFKPFYKTHDRRYSVYFDLYNEEKWEKRLNDERKETERKEKLEDMTYDGFKPGDENEEKAHNLRGEDLNRIRDFKGRHARGAERGGWLAFDMKVDKGQAMDLVIEYWGGFTGSKTFDILVNDQKIATENISGKMDGYFIDVHYEIPEEITAATDQITIKFAPHEGHRAGPFFYARIVRK